MKHTLAASALRGLLDATPGAVGCFDANLRAVYANTAFTMTTGKDHWEPLIRARVK